MKIALEIIEIFFALLIYQSLKKDVRCFMKKKIIIIIIEAKENCNTGPTFVVAISY